MEGQFLALELRTLVVSAGLVFGRGYVVGENPLEGLMVADMTLVRARRRGDADSRSLHLAVEQLQPAGDQQAAERIEEHEIRIRVLARGGQVRTHVISEVAYER